jgi:hypothetical protein
VNKKLSVLLGILLIFPTIFAQQVVDDKELLKAKEEGTVLFESVLKDADFCFAYWNEPTRSNYHMGYWTLKFENGAVVKSYEFSIGSEECKSIWWIGGKYIVYKRKSKGEWHLRVELLEEK